MSHVAAGNQAKSSFRHRPKAATLGRFWGWNVRYVAVACLLICSVSLIGCSGELSRSEALSPMMRQTSFQTHANMFATVGSFSASCDGVLSTEERFLQKAGFLTVTRTGPGRWNVALTEKGKVAIDGEPYAHAVERGCDHWQVTIPAFKATDVQVTGIKQNGPTSATAEYMWKWEPTNVGRALMEPQFASLKLSDLDKATLAYHFSQEGAPIASLPLTDDTLTAVSNATFSKYDDGWRLK